MAVISTSTYGTSNFKRDVHMWMIRKDKTVYDWITLCSGVITRDAMFHTPPRSKTPETWATQKKAGEARIRHEVERLFPKIQVPHVIQDPAHARAARYVEKYIAQRNLSALEKMFADFGVQMPAILMDADAAVHQGAKDYRGRVRKGVRYPIFNVRSREALIRVLMSHVGRLKAGLMEAVRVLNVKRIPKWISQHNTLGAVNDQRRRKGDPFFAAMNLSPKTNGVDTEAIIKRSIDINRAKMMTYIKFQLGKLR